MGGLFRFTQLSSPTTMDRLVINGQFPPNSCVVITQIIELTPILMAIQKLMVYLRPNQLYSSSCELTAQRPVFNDFDTNIHPLVNHKRRNGRNGFFNSLRTLGDIQDITELMGS